MGKDKAFKIGKNKNNRNIVTGRIIQTYNNKKALYLSIGKNITDILGWKAKDLVGFFKSLKDDNYILIKKHPYGYTLSGIEDSSSFLKFTKVCNFLNKNYKLSQTTELEYEVGGDNLDILVINLNNLNKGI